MTLSQSCVAGQLRPAVCSSSSSSSSSRSTNTNPSHLLPTLDQWPLPLPMPSVLPSPAPKRIVNGVQVATQQLLLSHLETVRTPTTTRLAPRAPCCVWGSQLPWSLASSSSVLQQTLLCLNFEPLTRVARSLTPSGPAKRSGKLFPGDIIVKVNDTSVINQPLQLCQSIITGPPASAVKFTIQRFVAGVALPLQVAVITRDMPSSPASALKQQQHMTGVTGLCIDRSIVVQSSVGGLQVMHSKSTRVHACLPLFRLGTSSTALTAQPLQPWRCPLCDSNLPFLKSRSGCGGLLPIPCLKLTWRG
jgi:hypothetical protein